MSVLVSLSHNYHRLYVVPFDEDQRNEEVWFLDHDYLESMSAMFRKVNCKSNVFLDNTSLNVLFQLVNASLDGTTLDQSSVETIWPFTN